jgi:hypothetical protein
MSFSQNATQASVRVWWWLCCVLHLLFFPLAADPDNPVFEMLYERNPVHSHFERRLHVSTRPLNIIYNPQAIKKVADFFYKGKVHTSG